MDRNGDNAKRVGTKPRATLYDTLLKAPEYFSERDRWRLAVYEKNIKKSEYIDFDGIKEGMLIIDFHLKDCIKGTPEYCGIYKTVKKPESCNLTHHKATLEKSLFTSEKEDSKKEFWRNFILYALGRRWKEWKDGKIGERSELIPIDKVIDLMEEFYS